MIFKKKLEPCRREERKQVHRRQNQKQPQKKKSAKNYSLQKPPHKPLDKGTISVTKLSRKLYFDNIIIMFHLWTVYVFRGTHFVLRSIKIVRGGGGGIRSTEKCERGCRVRIRQSNCSLVT